MAYADEVLADSPLGYWKFEDASGASATDASGNARPLTLNGTITWGHPTVMPNGLSSADFPNVTTAYFTRTVAAWMAVSSFTVEAWIQPDTVSSYDCIISRENSQNASRQWSFYITNGKLNLFTTTDRLGTATLTVGTAYHVAATYDSATSTLRYYINGALDATFTSASVSNSQTVSPYDLFVGVSRAGSSGLSFPFDGRINHVAYYPSALSGTRIAAHYSAATAAPGIDTPAAITDWVALPVTIPINTDNSNGMGGWQLGGYATARVTTPVAADPFPGEEGVELELAKYLPPPTIVNGEVQ